MTELMHLTSGDSTADALSLADLPGDFRVWADSLDCGPLVATATDDDARFTETRAVFALQAGWIPSVAMAQQTLDGWNQNIEDARKASECVLWFEHDLFDQLALAHVLWRLSRGPLPQQLTMVSIDRHPEVPDFRGFGALKPDQLAALWPRRVPVSKEAIDEATAAWIALTSPDPRGCAYLARRVRALPFLAGALERHLEEFPDVASGLSRTERQVLAAVARGAKTAVDVMREVHAIDPRYTISDVVLLRTLSIMADAGLLEAPGSIRRRPWKVQAVMHEAGLGITEWGTLALAASLDRVTAAGIDDWRGGVRLSGRGPVWRWDSSEKRVVYR